MNEFFLMQDILALKHQGVDNDFLFLAARLVAYWPAPIHAVALPAYTVLT